MFGPSGDSRFDTAFIIFELLGFFLLILAIFLLRKHSSKIIRPLFFVEFLIIVVIPVYWYLAYPVSNSIEGAGRIVALGVFWLPNLVISISLTRIILKK